MLEEIAAALFKYFGGRFRTAFHLNLILAANNNSWLITDYNIFLNHIKRSDGNFDT